MRLREKPQQHQIVHITACFLTSQVLFITIQGGNTMVAQWKAVSIVPKGMVAKNKWKCFSCSKECSCILPLSETPNAKCKGGLL